MGSIVRGSVTDRPWGQTLAALWLRRATGQLTIETDGRRFELAFDQGAIVAARSPLTADSVARIALTNHLLIPSQVQLVAARVAAAPDRDEVSVVAELTNMPAQHVERLRTRVLAQRAARTFSIEHGEFTLVDEVRLPRAGKIEIPEAIFLGAQHHLPQDRLLTDLRRLGSHFVFASNAAVELARFGFTTAERPILEALLRGTSLAELESLHRDIDPRAAQAVVYALVTCNAIEASGVAAEPAPAPAEAPPLARTATTPRSEVTRAPATARPGFVRTATTPGPNVTRAPAAPPPGTARTVISQPGAPRTMTAQPAVSRTMTPRPGAPRTMTAQPSVSRTMTPQPGAPRAPTARPLVARTTTPAQPGVARTTTPSRPAISRTATPSSPAISRTATPSSPAISRTATPGQPTVARTGTPTRPAATRVPTRQVMLPRADTAGPLPPEPNEWPTASRTTTARRTALAAHEIEQIVQKKIPLIDQDADHFELLGVPWEAPIEAVREAYFSLARQLHPDRLAEVGVADLSGRAKRVFDQISLAFAVLTDPDRRAAYLANPTQKPLDPAAAAKEAYRRGEMLMRADQPEKALVELDKACQLSPQNVDYRAMQAWARFCAARDKDGVALEIRKVLQSAIHRSDNPEIPRFFLGRVERMLGREREALRHFQLVLELQPSHADAASEVRVLEARLASARR